MDAAKQELHRLTASAKEAASSCGEGSAFFVELAESLEIRKY
jgi:hypothetical protein